MKRFIYVILFILLSFTIINSDDWQHCVLPESAWGYVSLDIDSQDRPHIIYSHPPLIRYAYYSGTEWIYEDIDGTEDLIYSLALDEQDIPHISYYEWIDSDNSDLYYCYWDGDEWIIELVDGEDSSGGSNSIAIDSEGYPHIVYSHYNGENGLIYAYKDDAGWNYDLYDSGGDCSLVLDSQNNPHISYCKSYSSERYMIYAHYDGVSWQIETVEENDLYDTGYSSIVVDSEDNPHIAYWDGYQDFIVRYAYNDGSGWSIEDVDECWGDVSLALDSYDYPHIAYCDEDFRIRYASLNETNWDIEIACNYGMLGQLSVSLKLDSDDKPHIATDEWVYLDNVYLWYGDPHPEINLTSFSAEPQEDAIALNWSVETTEGEHISGFNLYRREVGLTDTIAPVPGSEDTHTRWTRINSSLITGSNPYSYIDRGVEGGTTYEYELEAVVEDTPETLGTTTGRCGLPTSFEIVSLHPNPTTDEVNITLSTPETTEVLIEVYDITGRLVISSDVGEIGSGEHTEVLSTSELSSGVYTVKAVFTGRDACATKRMVVVR